MLFRVSPDAAIIYCRRHCRCLPRYHAMPHYDAAAIYAMMPFITLCSPLRHDDFALRRRHYFSPLPLALRLIYAIRHYAALMLPRHAALRYLPPFAYCR